MDLEKLDPLIQMLLIHCIAGMKVEIISFIMNLNEMAFKASHVHFNAIAIF